MRRSIVITVLIALLGCFALGWWLMDAADSSNLDVNDKWISIDRAQGDGRDYAELARQLKLGNMFPDYSNGGEGSILIAESAVKVGVPAFPKIVGASQLNGETYVHLMTPDNFFVKAKAGDILQNGWRLLLVDFDQVSAVYGDTEKDFRVVDYGL